MEIKRIDPEKRLSFQELMQLYLYSAIRSGTGKLPEYRSWRLTEGLIRAFNQEERSVLQNRLDALLRQDPGPVTALRRTYEAQPWEVEKPVIWDDRSKSNYYISNLEDSHRFEVYAEWVFRQYGIDIGLFYSRQQQYEVGETRAGIEIKHDKKSQETGNYYFEYMERLTAQGSWVESGLLKKDNTRYYFYGVIGDYLILPKDRLMDYYRRIVLENDPPAGCRKAEEGIHPDILHLRVPDGKSTIPVNSVRDSLRELALKPGEAPRRALVIHSAELLGVPGQNVLLATLEEPPGDVLFLLLAENERALLETVRSRCAILRLGAAEQKGGDELPNQAREILSAYRALINSRGTRGRAEGRCELLAAVYRLNKLKGSQIIEIASALRRECVREMVEAERLGRDARAFAGMERAAAEAIELAGSNVNAGHIGGRLTAALIEAADRFS